MPHLPIVLITATIGLIVAMAVGIPIVNWGVRRGYAKHTDKPTNLPAYFYGGVMPEDKRKPVGMERTAASGVNAIALQLSFIALAIAAGYLIRLGLSQVWSGFGKISDVALGIIGTLIVWPLMIKTKTSELVDKKTVNNIGGLCLEYLITSSIATLNLKSFQAYFVPIIIICAIETVICVVACIWSCSKFCKEEWFEKCLRLYGQVTGSASTGLALLRCVDPYGESSALDAAGVGGSVLSMPIWVTMVTVGPMIALSEGGFVKLLLIGGAIAGVSLVLGLIFFKVPNRKILGK